jgi:hypothetical protein
MFIATKRIKAEAAVAEPALRLPLQPEVRLLMKDKLPAWRNLAAETCKRTARLMPLRNFWPNERELKDYVSMDLIVAYQSFAGGMKLEGTSTSNLLFLTHAACVQAPLAMGNTNTLSEPPAHQARSHWIL